MNATRGFAIGFILPGAAAKGHLGAKARPLVAIHASAGLAGADVGLTPPLLLPGAGGP